MFNFLKPKRNIAKEAQEQFQKQADEMEVAHQKRLEEIRKNSNCVNIVTELVEYFLNKHVLKGNAKMELIDIIEHIDLNQKLCKDSQLQQILSDIKELEAGNNKDATKIFQKLSEYHVELAKKIG